MKYRLRDGIVLAEVCGQPMLVATGEALKYSRYMSLVNEDAAFYLELLKKPCSPEELALAGGGEFGADYEKILPIVEQFLASSERKGFLTRVDEDE